MELEEDLVPDPLDASAVRNWCRLALEALGRAREEIDAINVYPVPDGDTGTNLYLTVESAAQSVEAVFDGHASTGAQPDRAQAVHAMAHGALIGARGNSGTILAQLLRGMSQVLAEAAGTLPGALRCAVESAYQAVAHPVEGTMLTVARAAAEAAERAAQAAGPPAAVAFAGYEAARTALEHTPEQLAVLGRAGVVDAGGRGLVVLFGALAQALGGRPEAPAAAVAAPLRPARSAQPPDAGCPGGCVPGPAFEVLYLLDAPDAAIPALRRRLDRLGDSLVVVGGDGLWNVHVHADDAGAAVEAGVEAGRPHRIRITHFGQPAGRVPGAAPVTRAVVAAVRGAGLAELYEQAGATVVRLHADRAPASGDLAEAIRRANARQIVLLPNDAELRPIAGAAAEQARAEGTRVALIPTRSPVQGIAALAVHEAGRSFDEDVVAMTAAAGATRYAELVVAERESWTMAGVCQAGDALGMIDGDVAVIGGNLVETGAIVLDRMLAAGGELVTLVLGEDAPADLADRLQAHVREGHLAVDTVVYRGGQRHCPLIIGVE